MNFPVFFRQVFACTLIGFSASVVATVNYENGKEIDQNKCYACHAKKTGFGNGDMIYTRSDSKVNSLAKLKTMVERCNAELRLDLFPEDETDVAAYLNKQFYKFKQ
jgi:hypothetical protein